ncbi:hypothetical protein [Kitasatospora sp. NPDC085879]|uniref:hypothetical protein n=1 Tax=Kitasatospora sp. NPDC085879 TaxID=3154769 RepID=UPI00342A7B1E
MTPTTSVGHQHLRDLAAHRPEELWWVLHVPRNLLKVLTVEPLSQRALGTAAVQYVDYLIECVREP